MFFSNVESCAIAVILLIPVFLMWRRKDGCHRLNTLCNRRLIRRINIMLWLVKSAWNVYSMATHMLSKQWVEKIRCWCAFKLGNHIQISHIEKCGIRSDFFHSTWLPKAVPRTPLATHIIKSLLNFPANVIFWSRIVTRLWQEFMAWTQ